MYAPLRSRCVCAQFPLRVSTQGGVLLVWPHLAVISSACSLGVNSLNYMKLALSKEKPDGPIPQESSYMQRNFLVMHLF